MGEGKRDRSGQRQRSSHGVDVKSSSDSELAQGKGKGRRTQAKERWPFLEGLTVDELARYRRRRVQGHSKDNLGPCAEAKDENHLTEYRRAFQASGEDLLRDGTSQGKKKDLEEESSEHEKHEEAETQENVALAQAVAEPEQKMETETESSRFVAHANPVGRPALARRGTSLRREGEFFGDTETYSSYVAYEGIHRPELVRRPTSLRMEGEIDTMTEKCEKFIEWLNVSRPELMRMPSNLKLEGDLETSTENQEKYVPFVGARRPELLRQGTNLKLEGESVFVPEYTDVFKEHLVTERHVLKKPESHLKTGGEFHRSTETSENLLNPREREIQLMAELTRDVEEEEKKRKEEEKEERKQEEMNLLISKLEELKGPSLEVPEYKAAYKDFPRERPKVVRPEDEIGRADGSKVTSSPVRPRFPTKIDQDPEYKSRYLDYSRDRPTYQKPPIGPRPSQSSSRRSSGAFAKSAVPHESRRLEHENVGKRERTERDAILLTSEVKSQYVPYGWVPRVESTRIPTSLRLEGSLDLQPEYRNAYCSKRDYHAIDNHRFSRRRDSRISSSGKNENYWLSNNNSEQFGQVNAAQDQDAFQILHTRVHEDSVVGKPPPGSRRASQVQIQRPTHLELSERGSVRARSPSPTYRLHVCNVDDEPRGFGRRERSPSLQSSSRAARSPSPDALVARDHPTRPYSPSFGRHQPTERKSFVVLDGEDERRNERPRRRTDRNCNVLDLSSAMRGRPRSPGNWVPPWYDSTNPV